MKLLKGIVFILAMTVGLASYSNAMAAGNSDLFGQAKNGVYTNNFFKFSINYPSKWHIASQAQMEQLTKMGAKAAYGDKGNMQKLLKSGVIKKVHLFQISQKAMGQPGNAVIMAQAISIPKAFASSENSAKLLEATKYQLENVSNIKPQSVSKISSVTIGGKPFSHMKVDLKFGKMLVKEDFYITISNNYALLFVTAYVDNSQAQQLQQIVKSVTFQ